jgi:hypothetical protein
MMTISDLSSHYIHGLACTFIDIRIVYKATARGLLIKKNSEKYPSNLMWVMPP